MLLINKSNLVGNAFKMYKYSQGLGAVILLCVPLISCSKSASVNTINKTSSNDVRLPQLSNLDRYLRTQQSFTVLKAGFDANTQTDNNVIGLQSIRSENYPQPYPVPRTVKHRLAVKNSNGMNIIVNDLDIDPTSDFISLVPINIDGSESRPIILTGKLKEPISIRSLGFTKINLIFEARTIESHIFRGFSINYGPYGEVRLPGTQPPDHTLSVDQLQTTSKLLVIAKTDQTNTTWQTLKDLFATATNSYIHLKKLDLEQASSHNVTLTRVADCFGNWPDSEDCIEVEFAITLYSVLSDPSELDPYLEDHTPREPAGLTDDQLEEMWSEFGRSVFENHGINEYQLPDTRTTVLMWVSIAIGVCVVCFLVLVAIFRSSAFRDRWVEDDTIAIKSKEETNKSTPDDITMYPSPDQVIPEMYPGYHINSQIPSTDLGMDFNRRQSNAYDTINEAYQEDDGDDLSQRMKSNHAQQSEPIAYI